MASKTVDIIDKFGEWGTSDEFNRKLDIWMEVSELVYAAKYEEKTKTRDRKIARVLGTPRYRGNKDLSGVKSSVNIMIG